MPIIATGSKTIIDLSDGKSLSVYLGSNQPRTQIYNPNDSTYHPDWTVSTGQEPGQVTITPVVYANQQRIDLDDINLSFTWKRREGSGNETNLTTGETVSGNELTVSANKLGTISSGLLTYLAYVVYNDPDTNLPINATADITFTLVTVGTNGTDGSNAKLVWISGEQVFKYATATGTPTPTQITLTANLQGVTMSKWQYKNTSAQSGWSDYPTTSDNANITSATLIVKPTHTVFNNDVATIRVLTSDQNVSDVISIYKVVDGSTGASVSMAFLTNENITFPADKDGKVAATTVTCNVVAYTGTTKETPTVGTITGAPTGMTVSNGSASDNEIPITITVAANSTLGGTGPQSGVLSVPITAPVDTTLTINWSKVNTGATGAGGENAVVFTVYAPQGTTFVNQEGTLQLATQAYDGSTAISSGATYQWAQYVSGTWTNISGATSSTYTVDGSDVASTGTYKCTMSYNSKSYSDVITLIDKTDNYQATIDSTAGDVFKNTVGETYLICRLWQNGQETDTVKSTTYSGTAPTSHATGDFYYEKQSNSATTKLMRYSGSAWVDVTSDTTYGHAKTYTWYRRDQHGDPMDSGNPFATGKVIFVDGDDVTNKTVFTCEVS